MTRRLNNMIFATLMTSLLVVGCCPKPTLSSVTRDSVRVQREYVERLRSDTVMVKVADEFHTQRVTRDTLSIIAHDNVTARASISDGLLLHSLDITPKMVVVPITVKDIYTRNDSVLVTRERIEVPIKQPIGRLWQLLIASGMVLWGLVAFRVYRYVLTK